MVSRALVTGATGLIGARLVDRLARAGARVVVLARNPDAARAKLAREADVRERLVALAWDTSKEVPREAMQGVDAVFHLAGEPLNTARWSDEHKARIASTRVEGTRRVVAAIGDAHEKPRVLVSASGVGYYGSRGDEELTEESAPGTDFLADVCTKWEEEARAAEALGVRVVCARIGFVLGKDGGALAAMLPAFRMGVGGPLGDGKQWVPWVHVDDVVGMMLHVANTTVAGPMNLVSPHPVTNADFARELGRALHRPAFFRAPAFALKIALGEITEAILASQRATPAVAIRAGYPFRYDDLAAALRDELSAKGKAGTTRP